MTSYQASTQNPVSNVSGLNNGLTSSSAPQRVNNLINVPAATATLDLNISQDGATFVVQPSVALAIALPPVGQCKDVQFTIVCGGTAFAADFVITSQSAVLNGTILCGNTPVACAGGTTITSAHANNVAGDYINLVSDGVSWFVDARCTTAAALVVA